MKITSTNGNAKNGLRGSRVTIRASDGKIVDSFEMPGGSGLIHCKDKPHSYYGTRYRMAVETCKQYEAFIEACEKEEAFAYIPTQEVLPAY